MPLDLSGLCGGYPDPARSGLDTSFHGCHSQVANGLMWKHGGPDSAERLPSPGGSAARSVIRGAESYTSTPRLNCCLGSGVEGAYG